MPWSSGIQTMMLRLAGMSDPLKASRTSMRPTALRHLNLPGNTEPFKRTNRSTHSTCRCCKMLGRITYNPVDSIHYCKEQWQICSWFNGFCTHHHCFSDKVEWQCAEQRVDTLRFTEYLNFCMIRDRYLSTWFFPFQLADRSWTHSNQFQCALAEPWQRNWGWNTRNMTYIWCTHTTQDNMHTSVPMRATQFVASPKLECSDNSAQSTMQCHLVHAPCAVNLLWLSPHLNAVQVVKAYTCAMHAGDWHESSCFAYMPAVAAHGDANPLACSLSVTLLGAGQQGSQFQHWGRASLPTDKGKAMILSSVAHSILHRPSVAMLTDLRTTA